MANIELKDLAPLLLKKERANGDVDPSLLAPLLNKGAKNNARRKEILKMVENHPVLSDRDMMFRNHTERYNFGVKKTHHFIKFLKDHNLTDKDDQQRVYEAIMDALPIDVHRTMFIPTIENQGDDDQQKKWLPLARNFQILGSYAQTELGHGSNIQGIETTAHYDKAKEEFIINSPTLTSRKWWPGGLGKTATHAMVHARLFLEGKSAGIQAFIVQVRSLKDHQPLPGVEVGDIGPKVGFNSVDNGYCAFHNVRIPRDQMMMRYAKVLPDGTFIRPKSDKLVYLTMVQVRSYMLLQLSGALGMVTTIATRFSAARIQGRKADGKGEFQVLDYQNQQLGLFTNIAISFATHFAGQMLADMHDSAIVIVKNGGAASDLLLAQLHAVASGLKAWTAESVTNGMEACRRMCGGHGFSNSSGINHLYSEFVGCNTFEGTLDVLVQQHSRYLVKVLMASAKNKGGAKNDSLTGFLGRAKMLADPSLRCKAETATDFLYFDVLCEGLEVRAARIVIRLAKELQATNNDLNKCMVHMTRASTAHAELMLLNAFVAGVAKVPAGPTREAVANLCSLFGVWLLSKGLGDFREDNYLSSGQAELVRAQLVALLPVVRKNAVLLTDGWDFTDFELNSSIGRYDGDIYRALVERAKDEPLNKTSVADSYEAYLKPLIHSGL